MCALFEEALHALSVRPKASASTLRLQGQDFFATLKVSYLKPLCLKKLRCFFILYRMLLLVVLCTVDNFKFTLLVVVLKNLHSFLLFLLFHVSSELILSYKVLCDYVQTITYPTADAAPFWHYHIHCFIVCLFLFYFILFLFSLCLIGICCFVLFYLVYVSCTPLGS